MTPANILAIVAAACFFAAGWLTEGNRKNAEIARIQRAQAEQRAADLQQHLDDITAAEELGRTLVARLAATEAERDTASQEKNDAIRRLTVGRRCLDSAAVRVLNQRPQPGLVARAVPQAASEPVSADAAFATDTDVGIWIASCQRGYDTCRGRLQAIADFYDQEETTIQDGEAE